MNKKLVTKVLAAATGAMMCAGMFTTGVGTPATQVEACDFNASQINMLKGAFDAKFYANRYPDVKQTYGMNEAALFNHFINHGMCEGRMENANFDPKAYIQAYADVAKYCNGDYSKAYEHYIRYGQNEDRNLTTFALLSALGNGAGKSAVTGNSVAAALKNNVNFGDKEINIGYGLTAVLTAEQMKDADITIMQNALGYGAYLNGNLIASTPYYLFDEEDAWYVQTIDVGVDSVSDLTGAPIAWGNDVSTYYNDNWSAYPTDYHHYTNGQAAALIPWSTTESVDWYGTDNTPYVVAFGFGEYNQNYVETGVTTYSPATGFVDSTETGVVTNVPWGALGGLLFQ